MHSVIAVVVLLAGVGGAGRALIKGYCPTSGLEMNFRCAAGERGTYSVLTRGSSLVEWLVFARKFCHDRCKC